MKLLNTLLSTTFFLSAGWLPAPAALYAATPFNPKAATFPINPSLLSQPYISAYDYLELVRSPEVAPQSITEAVMHVRSSFSSKAPRIEVLARVELLNSRPFESFELRLASPGDSASGHARVWLWRSGSAVERPAGWEKLQLPGLLSGHVSGMAFPLVRDSLSLTETSVKLDLLPALKTAAARTGDLILIEDLDQPEGTFQRFARVLTLKDKPDVFLKELGQGRLILSTGAYQARSPAGSTIIFPKLAPEGSEPHSDGTTTTNVSLDIGGASLQFGLQSLFVNALEADGTVITDGTMGHTVPRTLSFAVSSPRPRNATLKIYKAKTLVATLPLTSGRSVDLSSIEDADARHFTKDNQYGLVMTVSWGGREYAFLNLIQGLQDPIKPHGASLPY